MKYSQLKLVDSVTQKGTIFRLVVGPFSYLVFSYLETLLFRVFLLLYAICFCSFIDLVSVSIFLFNAGPRV